MYPSSGMDTASAYALALLCLRTVQPLCYGMGFHPYSTRPKGRGQGTYAVFSLTVEQTYPLTILCHRQPYDNPLFFML